MPPTPLRDPQAAHLEALCQRHVLDTDPEPAFEAFVRLATILCNAPMAFISLNDGDRLWCKAHVGLPQDYDMPAMLALGSQPWADQELFEISDVHNEARYANHPLVKPPAGVRFYPHTPIRLSSPQGVGLLCVMDHQPRCLSEAQRAGLKELSKAVAHAFEERALQRQLRLDAAEFARAAVVLEHSSDAVIRLSPDATIEGWNPAAATMFGYGPEQIIGQSITVLMPDPKAHDENFAYWESFEHRNYEAVRCTRQGGLIDVMITLVPEVSPQGELLGATKFIRDITPSKRISHTLQMSEARFRALSDSAPLGVFFADLSGVCTYTNARWHSMHELSGELAHLWLRKVHPEDVARVKDRWSQLTQEPLFIEFRIVRNDGSVATLHTRSQPVMGPDGAVIGAAGSVDDITLRKQQEEALRIHQNFMDRAGRLASVGGWVLEFGNQQLDWSDEVCRIHGLTPGHPPRLEECLEFYTPDSQAQLRAALDRAMAHGDHFDLELQMLHPDGVLRWLRTVGTTDLEGNRPVRLIGVFQDISHDVLKRQALMRSQERGDLATTAGGIGIWELDLVSKAMVWDPLMYSLYGIPETNSPPNYDRWRAQVHPEDWPDVEAWMENSLQSGQDITHEFRVIWPNESVHLIESAMRVKRDTQGKAVRMVGVNRDVTHCRQTELELKQSNAELEQFAYIASHDLQEPLRMVANFTELLAQRYQGQLDERADQYIHYAVDGARRMQGLVNDLLAYSRVGAQGKPLQAVETQPIIDAVCVFLKPTIDETGAVIECINLPKVMGDGLQLGQLFQNLISNALKFRSTQPHIVIEAKRLADRWLFSVRDNGIGIDMRYSQRVFQMFQRLHERSLYAGSGIGLSIAKRVVERHEGKIWLESTLGLGTTFFFTLKPATTASAPAAAPKDCVGWSC